MKVKVQCREGREYYEFRLMVRKMDESQMEDLEKYLQKHPILVEQTPLTEEKNLYLVFRFHNTTWPRAWEDYSTKFREVEKHFTVQTASLYYCRYDRSFSINMN